MRATPILLVALATTAVLALGVTLRSSDGGGTSLRGRLLDASGAPWTDRPLQIVERRLLDGRVDPTAKEIAAYETAYETGRGGLRAELRTDENGEFEARGLLRDGEFHVFTKSQTRVSYGGVDFDRRVTRAALRPGPEPRVLIFVNPHLVVRVLGGDVGKAPTLALYPWSARDSRVTDGPDWRPWTVDGDGAQRIPVEAGRDYLLTLRAPSRPLVERVVSIDAADSETPVTLELPAPRGVGSIAAALVDPNGAPYTEPWSLVVRSRATGALVDVGRGEVRDLPPGEYRVQAVPRNATRRCGVDPILPAPVVVDDAFVRLATGEARALVFVAAPAAFLTLDLTLDEVGPPRSGYALDTDGLPEARWNDDRRLARRGARVSLRRLGEPWVWPVWTSVPGGRNPLWEEVDWGFAHGMLWGYTEHRALYYTVPGGNRCQQPLRPGRWVLRTQLEGFRTAELEIDLAPGLNRVDVKLMR